MLESIYLFLWITGIALSFLSFYKSTGIFAFFPFLASLLFFVLGLVSYSIEIVFCQAGNVTVGEWTCYVFNKQEPGLALLAYGLGLLMIAYAIINTFAVAGKAIKI